MNKEITKKKTQEVAKPSTTPRGFENEDAKDLLLPRIELLQGLSAAVQEGKGKAGEIVNQISKAPLPTNTFIPIAMHRKYIKWIPRNEGGGIEYQTANPNDERVLEDTKWGQHGEKPTCTSYMNFLVLLEGQTLPIVLSFSMTNYQEGRKLYTMCKMAGCDIWLKKYKIASKSKTNNSGTWHVFDISEAGDTDPKDAKIAEELFTTFSERDLNFEVEGSSTAKQAPADKDEDY